MNCETFDSLLLDELYGELDDETSAEVRRHAADCVACGDALAKMRKTREAAALPYLEPPADLEDRILAATRDARPAAAVVPIRRKLGSVVSLAGAWAMRPQTAMAAVFLLMIGSSLTFLHTHRSKSGASSAVAVSEQGSPLGNNAAQASAPSVGGQLAGMVGGAAASASQDEDDKDLPNGAVAMAPAPMATMASPQMLPPSVGPAVAMATPPIDGLRGYARKATADSLDDDEGSLARRSVSGGGGATAHSAPSQVANGLNAPASPASPPAGSIAYGGVKAGGVGASSGASDPGSFASSAQAAPKPKAAAEEKQAPDGMTAGMTAYRAKNFSEAQQDFDSVASGDVTAALWAARATREASGCSAAVSRFDDVAARAPSSTVGFDAKLEAGRCFRSMGDTESARARLVPLLTVPSHAARAQTELAAMTPATARPSKSGPRAF